MEHIIPEQARKAGVYEIYVEHSSNGMFGIDNMDPPDVSCCQGRGCWKRADWGFGGDSLIGITRWVSNDVRASE